MSLSAFLLQNAEKPEAVKYIASKRFKENGKPIEWVIQPVDAETDTQIRKGCTKQIPVPGKRGQFTKDTDYDKYLATLAVRCITYPDLHNKELQDSYSVMGAEALLTKLLLPGEMQDLLNKIQEVNGYDATMDELVDEAKNSLTEATATQM